ncbi:MAG: DsrE/DsrF/DrsH-like family protein [Bacteroidales bacterium]|nr:DsrE/DsrF/DrsH-like family protein [Bacteroidales bacterium]
MSREFLNNLTFSVKYLHFAYLSLVEAAKALEINLYACEMAMHVLGLKREDFIPEVKDVLGVASFLKISEGGQTLFI